jgi:hypothetical protein
MNDPGRYIARAVLIDDGRNEDDEDLDKNQTTQQEPTGQYERRYQEDNKGLQGTDEKGEGKLEKDYI